MRTVKIDSRASRAKSQTANVEQIDGNLEVPNIIPIVDQENRLRWNQISNVADPDPRSGAFFTHGSEMGKKSRSGSRINIPDHISESSETWVKILKGV